MTTSDTSRETPVTEFTALQLSDWAKFERVRKGGKYNMFDPRARAATKLDRDDFLFVMKHYSALKAAADAERSQP